MPKFIKGWLMGDKGDDYLQKHILSYVQNPGVGSYNVSKTQQSLEKIKHTTTFGAHVDRFKPIKPSPGIGSYNVNGLTNTKTYSFGYTERPLLKEKLRFTTEVNFPGPGEYESKLENLQKGYKFPKTCKNDLNNSIRDNQGNYCTSTLPIPVPKTYKFNKQANISCMLATAKLNHPGVGQYIIKRNFEKAEMQKRQKSHGTLGKLQPLDFSYRHTTQVGPYSYDTQQKIKKQIEPSYKFETAKKKDIFKDIKKNDPENPSPATYNSDIIQKVIKGLKLPQSIRVDYTRFNKNPGVGRYNIETDINRSKLDQNASLLSNKSSSNWMLNKSIAQILEENNIKQMNQIQKIIVDANEKEIQSLIDRKYTFDAIKKINEPSASSYKIRLDPDKKINFTKSCRREEFLDIFNIKTFEERSPGPAAKYCLEKKPSLVKSFTKRIRKDIFDIQTDKPGVAGYYISNSQFDRFTNILNKLAKKTKKTQKSLEKPILTEQVEEY